MQKAPKRFDGSLAAFTGLEMSLFSIPRLTDHRNFQVVDSIYFFFLVKMILPSQTSHLVLWLNSDQSHVSARFTW